MIQRRIVRVGADWFDGFSRRCDRLVPARFVSVEQRPDRNAVGRVVCADFGPSCRSCVPFLVDNRRRCTPVEEMFDHAKFAELYGEVEAGDAAIRRGINRTSRGKQMIDDLATTIGRSECECFAEDLRWFVTWGRCCGSTDVRQMGRYLPAGFRSCPSANIHSATSSS